METKQRKYYKVGQSNIGLVSAADSAIIGEVDADVLMRMLMTMLSVVGECCEELGRLGGGMCHPSTSLSISKGARVGMEPHVSGK